MNNPHKAAVAEIEAGTFKSYSASSKKLLVDCTDKEIKDYTSSLGYEFDDEDCIEIRKPGYVNETLEEAVNDFLDAYER